MRIIIRDAQMRGPKMQILFPWSTAARRIAITAVAVAVSYALSYVPIPGIALERFAADTDASGPYWSIAHISVQAWYLAVLFAELIILLLPAGWTARIRSHSHADPFSRYVVVLTIAIAFYFAARMVIGLEQSIDSPDYRLLNQRGLVFRLEAMAALIGATALTIYLGRIIQTLGIGSGFWVLMTASIIPTIASAPTNIFHDVSGGQIARPSPMLIATIIAAFAFLLIALVRARHQSGFTSGETLIWPIAFYEYFSPNVSLYIQKIFPAPTTLNRWYDPSYPSYPAALLAAAIVIAASSARYAQREGSQAFLPFAVLLLFAFWFAEVYGTISLLVLPMRATELVIVAVVTATIANQALQAAKWPNRPTIR